MREPIGKTLVLYGQSPTVWSQRHLLGGCRGGSGQQGRWAGLVVLAEVAVLRLSLEAEMSQLDHGWDLGH